MKKFTLLFFLLNVTFLFAQKEISGVVKDNTGAGLPGVNIIEKGTNNGVSTDIDGAYKIKVKDGATLVFSYVGFNKVEKAATSSTIDVVLAEEGGQALDEIVVTGTRTAPRSNTTTALPIDVLSAKDLASTGQASFDKALQYKIPSFNTVQTPVNDATSLLDPYEIRNMGPSRTLILINGKRKNLSSLLYVQTSPGRGETGADISAIPTDAIERVEILRDGASAQYGSDAIAGVMNIILKKNTGNGSVTVRSGITSEGDGEMLGVSLNNGSTVGEKGFVNYTVDFSKVNLSNRPGTVDAAGDAGDFGASLSDVQAFLAKKPDAGNINGSPETAAAKFLVNGGFDLSDETQLYYNAAYVYKKVNSFANYRTPYWRTLASYPYLNDFFGNGDSANPSYNGYVPTFVGDLGDYNATLGYKSKKNGWNTDASITAGGNKQTYTVENSHNRSDLVDPISGEHIYQENSPITFKPGGTSFNHIVGNIDISKAVSDKVSIGIGSEFRTENFEVVEGDKASWEGTGADSFAGNRPENSGKWNRYNLGAYFDLAYDITENFLINGTVRYENYSDFGDATVGKLSLRYKFLDDKITLRGSASTGFRAPTLHQIYTQKSQYSFVPGQGIQVSGIINNVSPQARQLGIPQLDAEKSTNITVGIGAKPIKNFNFTLDYYNIKVEDRIILSDEVATQFGTVSWFANAFDSRTSGLDVVMNYTNIMLGDGKLGFNLSGNVTFQNERISDVTNASFGPDQESLMFTSRPETKWILGGNYEIGKFGFSLNNTYFGKATFHQKGMSPDLRTEFTPKVVTDLGINFSATDKLTLALNVNNLLNVLPEWEFKAENAAGTALLNNPAQVKSQFNLITFNGRYSQMTYDGYHFSQLGTMFNLSLNYKF
ncbi:TonB-dependent receptor [Flavobacterium gawalongense]|uniref:TonB-dependent receptor n=1 Tax=Flavobacterium gawalongense TaxID=2594432 RepID=A0A553BR61_9FLAO|nr:TonB-dependent receptor [Flavobacterium gawalongense]TRX03405.1 TonB-dependent receptor [Flavobacterium gawalongense]TRX06827.1 TonB-dependent receptor [Flavobacterium gawalongense]TRX10753.1 TonB-dependent receptor [Flavobacterium gawalongense]TRX11476.1 TonB-dependent receptor [Flavobacterium gawalongense]TRX29245.1 TonB-dependent receptor [Flavobacterium gawalongense]